MSIKKLNEYVTTNHWTQRVSERAINISDIIYPAAIFQDVVGKEELKVALDERVKKIIRARILVYQTLQDQDPSKYVTTAIVTLQLKKNDKLYVPTIKTVSDGKEHIGNSYIGFTYKNTLLTLENIPQENTNLHYLTQATIKHWKNKNITLSEDDVEVKIMSNHIALLSVDSVITQLNPESTFPAGVPKTETDLPYKVKRDYIKSSKGRPNFITHSDLGRGEIISSEQGMGGKWSNVSIKFPSGVKLFKTLYAASFF